MKRYARAADIKVGVIGYGGAFNMGKSHLDQMAEAGMTPTAVAEIDPARLEVAEKDFPGIETYASVAELLRKSTVDLLAIITPHNTHADLSVQCLRAGRHVMCEKPLAITTAECDRMIAAAKKAGVVLSTYHNRHWDGCILEAVDRVLGQGAIGDVFRVEAHMGGYGQPRDWWRSSKSISGGILYDWGVHLLEYALQIMGPRAKLTEVTGYAKTGYWAPKTAWKADTNEDEAQAVARFADGRWLTLTMSSLDAHDKGDRGMLEITGTQGTYHMHGNRFEIITKGAGGVEQVVRGPNRKGEQQTYYRNIADHLVKGTKLVITPEWSRRPIHILDLACRSIGAGRAMKAKYA